MARHLRGRLPLRVRLVAATLILVATGLVASGIAVTSMLQHRLTSRIDRVLLEEAQIWAQITLPLAPDPYPGHNPDRPPSRFYVRVISPDGQSYTALNDNTAIPAVPANNDVGRHPTTLPSIGGSKTLWRAVSVRASDGYLTTVAIDLADVRSTVRSLVLLQVGIGSAVLVVPGVAGYAVVRRSLRPLAEFEQTAAAIGAGSWIAGSRSGIRELRSAGFRWRSTECWHKFSGRWRPRNLPPKRPGIQRTGCDSSSPTPAMNCVPR